MRNLKKFVVVFLSCLMFVNVKTYAKDEIELVAKAAVLIEASSGRILYAKNSNDKMYPASTTKILTALVALDYLPPEKIITVGKEINDVSLDSSKAGHVRGESITVENLIRALMLPSGNDTGCVLANAVAKEYLKKDNIDYSVAEKTFCDLMNKKANELGAENTHFANPHGYHAPNHYTTAHDLALISKEAMKNDLIRQIAKEEVFDGNGADNTDGSLQIQHYHWATHNRLLKVYPYATGLKTGFTDEAGSCFVGSAQKNGIDLISVVLFSTDEERWSDTTKLLDYGFNNYSLKVPYKSNTNIGKADTIGGRLFSEKTIDLLIKDDVKLYATDDEINNIKFEIELDKNLTAEDSKSETIKLKAPIKKNQTVGKAVFSINGEKVFETTVLAANDLEANTFFNNAKFIFHKTFSVAAIPYWIGIIIILFFIIKISSTRKRRKNNLLLKRR